MEFTDTSLFNFLPHTFEVDILETDEDAIYDFAHNLVITATEFASLNTKLNFEDFDEEREDAIVYVMHKIKKIKE